MITAKGLTKYYGDRLAISEISFDIKSGEIVGILGLNGAGKSTTLRILSCLLLPSSGTVSIKGIDALQHPHEVRKLVGFLPEIPPLYNEMTIESYLSFVGQLRGLSKEAVKSRLETVMELTNVTERRNQVIEELSHGFRKRVGIAQAIIHEPAVLILDEPISGLDPVQIVEMREMILNLKGKHTILLSSHILSEISQTCDRILMIQDGRIVAQGTETELTSTLSQGQKLHLIVRGDTEKILTLLRTVADVKSCQAMIPTMTAQEGVVHVEVITTADIRERLSKTVIDGGFGLLQLSPAEGELESIFLQLSHKHSAIAAHKEAA